MNFTGENNYFSNSSNVVTTGTETSYTPSNTYSTFVSGRSIDDDGVSDYTIRVGGVNKTLSMRNGSDSLFDPFACFLPPGGRISLNSPGFYYLAVQMRPA